jgi:hypothetical protein
MPQIFFQYQSTIDQFEGGQDNGRTTQVFSEAIETGILESILCILGGAFSIFPKTINTEWECKYRFEV